MTTILEKIFMGLFWLGAAAGSAFGPMYGGLEGGPHVR
jgi:hypothetical protein